MIFCQKVVKDKTGWRVFEGDFITMGRTFVSKNTSISETAFDELKNVLLSSF